MPHVFIDSFSQISAETRAGLPTWAAVGRNFSNIFDFVWILPQAVFFKSFQCTIPLLDWWQGFTTFPLTVVHFCLQQAEIRQRWGSTTDKPQLQSIWPTPLHSQTISFLHAASLQVLAIFPQYTLAPDHHYKTLLMTFRACYNLAPLLLTAWGLITLNF